MSASPATYRIRVRMAYEYAGAVPYARHVLRVKPAHTEYQRVSDARLRVAPKPGEYKESTDFFGNGYVMLAIDQPHDRLEIDYRAHVVRTSPITQSLSNSPACEAVRALLEASTDLGPWGPTHFVFPGASTGPDDAILAYAGPSFAPGRPILEAAFELTRRIHGDFRYEAEVTTVQTTAAEAIALRCGVCQDFAHVMIACLRAIGLPAAYISGLLRTEPPPGKSRLEGADAMHAWVAVWAGSELGWVEFDPTNAMLAGNDHIRIAHGREYADVAPIDGVIVTVGDHAHEVGVDVVPVEPAGNTS